MKYRKNNKDIECWCTNNLYVASLSNLNVSKEITIAHHTQGIKWNMETKYNGLWLYDFKNVKKEYISHCTSYLVSESELLSQQNKLASHDHSVFFFS